MYIKAENYEIKRHIVCGFRWITELSYGISV